MFLDNSRIGNFITTKSKIEIRINCPYCNDEKFHLYINLKKQLFHCFRCNAKGKTNVSKNLLGDAVSSILTKEPGPSNKQPLKLPESVPEIITAAARNYLHARGIKESDVIRHKIYCASPFSLYVGRLIIPSQSFHGFCEYFTGRAYVKHIFPKYLNPAGAKDKVFVSPLEEDSVHTQYWFEDTVMIVEGPFDYLKASRHGPTLALLGKNLSESARRHIISKYNKVIIMLDKGNRESIAALKIKDSIQNFVDRVHILSCPKKDPGEMDGLDFMEVTSTV